MAAKSGAGAAVSSGADYQSRFAAQLIALNVSKAEQQPLGDTQIDTIGFETAEAVDDINIGFIDKTIGYVQAKSKITFSINNGGEFHGVLAQFERQHASIIEHVGQRLILVCGPESSKTVTITLKAALTAFRVSPIGPFNRDQPSGVVKIITQLTEALLELRVGNGLDADVNEVHRILRKMEVLEWDVEPNSQTEFVTCTLLKIAGFGQPHLVLAKLIADCLAHAKKRHTVRIVDIADELKKLKLDDVPGETVVQDGVLELDFETLDINAGREVIVARFPENSQPIAGMAVLEGYRFDENCEFRFKFDGNKIRFANGEDVELLCRAATVNGLIRLIDDIPIELDEAGVTYSGINSDEDFDIGACAQIHAERVRSSLKSNANPTMCVHCGEAIFSSNARIIERGEASELVAGLIHLECLQPDDRVFGRVTNEAFDEYPELINFDVKGWAKAARRGPVGLLHLKELGGHDKIITWSGFGPDRETGKYVVELQLEEDRITFVTQRGKVSRFTSREADEFIKNFVYPNRTNPDPWCYSSETMEMGNRSVLQPRFGGSERILKMTDARKLKYSQAIDQAYSRNGFWYAPCCYLRVIETGEPFTISNGVPIIVNPFELKNFLKNWRGAELAIPEYEVVTLTSDDKFDSFLRTVFMGGLVPVVDPLLDPDDPSKPIAGTEIVIAPSVSTNIS